MFKNDESNLLPTNAPRIGIIIGTGPSITPEVIKSCNKAKINDGVMLFGCNLTFKDFHLDVFHACNKEFYDTYWNDGLKDIKADKWTWNKDSAKEYGLSYIDGIWADGLSKDPTKIHYHHGSNPQLMNIALHYGVTKMILVGWDMRYPIGEKRHYFGDGEYPKELQHWPSVGLRGEMAGLIKEMETINPADYDIEIINCTPDSAMTCFPMMDLDECLQSA